MKIIGSRIGQSRLAGFRASASLSVVLTLLLAMISATNAAVVYDNSSDYLGVHAGTAQQLGDEITLAGTERTVIELHIGVNLQGYSGTADFQAWIYANDGPEGSPGTMLWASEVMEAVPLSGENEFIVFDVPNITVPDTFTWTQQNRNATPVAVGIPLYDPPSIGWSEVHSWFGSPGSWTKNPGVRYPANYMARVIAVPEPGSIVLLSLGGIAIRRKRR